MRNFILLMLIVSLLSGFAKKVYTVNNFQSPAKKEAGLDSRKWYLTTIYTKKGFTQVMIKKAFISFDMSKESAGGNAGCNSFGATVGIEGNGISFKDIFSTKMYCMEMQSMEDDFLNQLRRVTRYEIKDDCLYLYAGDMLLLEFMADYDQTIR